MKVLFLTFAFQVKQRLAAELAGALLRGAMGHWLMQRQRNNVLRLKIH
jgi:hypothetical protein